MLAALAPRGLPPFEAVVLLLAACREGYRAPPARRDLLMNYAAGLGGAPAGPGAAAGARLDVALREVAAGLDAVASLPEELRRSPQAKSLVAETVFEITAPAIDAGVAAAVVELVEGTLNFSQMAIDLGAGAALSDFTASLDALAGLCLVDVDHLRLRAGRASNSSPPPPRCPR